MKKICKNCKEEKDVTLFTYRKERDSYRNICKSCAAKASMGWRNDNPDKLNYKPKQIVESNKKYNFEMKDFLGLEPLSLPQRCDNELCRMIIPDIKYCSTSSLSGVKKYYCDKWCREQGEINNITRRKCKYCDNFVEPMLNKNNGTIAGYKKLCFSCFEKRKKGELYPKKEVKVKKEKKLYVKKEKDLIGHTCPKCNEYKLWEEYHLVKGNRVTTCKICVNNQNKKWYYKDSQRSRKRGIEYYNSKKQLCQTEKQTKMVLT